MLRKKEESMRWYKTAQALWQKEKQAWQSVYASGRRDCWILLLVLAALGLVWLIPIELFIAVLRM